ncbi:4Fe-4S binding protein, partial [Intestinibacillus massiliensis]|nr:4Fe-4S binding protein [Intestinibacillus massiliensis]
MKITIDKNCCKGCGICLAICPKGIFIKSKKRNNYGTN